MRLKISYRGYRFPVGFIANLQLAEALFHAGKTREEAAKQLEISIRSVFRILRTRKDAEEGQRVHSDTLDVMSR